MTQNTIALEDQQETLSAVAESNDISFESGATEEALAVYRMVVADLAEQAHALPQGNIASRYHALLLQSLTHMRAHEEAIALLFSSAMRGRGDIEPGDISHGRKDDLYAACEEVVRGADDTPTKEDARQRLALLLYTFHFTVVLFWLYDRTEKQRATTLFIGYLRDLLKMIRPLIVLPMVTKAMHKLAQILMLVFGGARFTDETPSNAS